MQQRSAIISMTVVPNPRRCGGDTGGPSRSVQLMVKVSPAVPQEISTRPLRGLSLNLPAFGGRSAPLGLQVRKGDAFALALPGKLGTGLALALDRRKRRPGPAAPCSFLDRGIDLAESPVEVRDRVGHNLDPGRKGRVLRFDG